MNMITDLLADLPRRKKMLLSMLAQARGGRLHSPANASTVARKAIRSLIAGLRVEEKLDRVLRKRDLKEMERARSQEKGRKRNRLKELHRQPLLILQLVFITGLQTCVGSQVWVGQVQAWIDCESSTQNPHPCPGFDGYCFNTTRRVVPSWPH